MPFQKGNEEWKKRRTNNGGRPPRPVEEKYRKWLLARVKKKDWDYVVDTALARAKAGDHRARQWLSDWCLGKPIERREVTGAEGGPILITQVEFIEPDDA